jgi:hypothetical protein
MTYKTKGALVIAILAMALAPAVALAASQTAPPGHGQGHHGKPVGSPGKGPTGATGTSGATGATGTHPKPYPIKHKNGNTTPKAYGRVCLAAGESKTHVAGTKGTPFSQCVTAMAHLKSGKASNPTQACQGLSKKHVAGQNGTPYSDCVSAGAKLLRNAS